ncbi:prepilin-type N-terminal cleavage/methylation domain-containing protein [Verrucomicrobium sp. BvORR034]|uniref:prepilin-type N-terminal cleavage/methylation domain-containing protein n=1 Tax=Verrucomicrobium sp. BvORR034 TaxID=1396418 RepID=UPI0006791939|nr:prepilin-type N-terminal cleavage/methylation domain-containing protein [Verrucomicrobium sp. BvORR034]
MNLPASTCRARRGFSLLEVVLATGIISSSLLAVVCLLPVFMAVEQDRTQEPVLPRPESVAPEGCVLAGGPASEAGAGKLN